MHASPGSGFSLLFAVVFVLVSAGPGLAQAPKAAPLPASATEVSPLPAHHPPGEGPLADNELKPSTHVTWGRLKNGLRYAILPHASSPERVSLRLLVNVGALQESDDERGYAHFVEHMAFEGTKNFPAGQIVKLLQRLGAQNGPDINAETTLTHTIYQLELPDKSDANLETGLRIFRDFADGILFAPSQIKSESGVILGEKRSRKEFDNLLADLPLERFLYAGVRAFDRQSDIIGSISQIEHANRRGLQHFYNTWYRPERMCVAIVGDVNPARAEALVRAQFSSLAADGLRFPEPDFGKPTSLTEPFVGVHLKKEGGDELHLVSIAEKKHPDATKEDLLENVRLDCAVAILKGRLVTLAKEANCPIFYAEATVELVMNRFRQVHFEVRALGSGKSEAALTLLEQELRRGVEFGFTVAELESEKSRLRAEIRTRAESAPTTPVNMLCDQLTNSLDTETPFLPDDEFASESLQIIDRITSAGCQEILRTTFGPKLTRIFAISSADAAPTVEKLRATYLASQEVHLSPRLPPAGTETTMSEDRRSTPHFDGPPGEVADKQHVADLDLWLVRFANGVHLNLKRTGFGRGTARFSLRFGTGRLSEPANNPGLGLLVPELLTHVPLEHVPWILENTPDDKVELAIVAGENAFVAEGDLRADQVAATLKNLTTRIFKTEFNVSEFKVCSDLHRALAASPKSVSEVNEKLILPLLAGGDHRVGNPGHGVLGTRTLDELRAWLTPQVESGPIEITIVGDIELDSLIDAVAQTFGTLPARQLKPIWAEKRKLNFPSTPINTRYPYESAERQTITLSFFWPVHDQLTTVQHRRLALLALVLTDRVTDRIRGKDGATYAPQIGFTTSDVYVGFAYFVCSVEVLAEKADKYATVVQNLGATLARHGITPDELDRARAQTNASVQQAMISNEYWLKAILAGADETPSQLADARSYFTDLSATTVADINTLAARYLTVKDLCQFRIVPIPPEKPTKGPVMAPVRGDALSPGPAPL